MNCHKLSIQLPIRTLAWLLYCAINVSLLVTPQRSTFRSGFAFASLLARKAVSQKKKIENKKYKGKPPPQTDKTQSLQRLKAPQSLPLCRRFCRRRCPRWQQELPITRNFYTLLKISFYYNIYYRGAQQCLRNSALHSLEFRPSDSDSDYTIIRLYDCSAAIRFSFRFAVFIVPFRPPAYCHLSVIDRVKYNKIVCEI